MFIILIITVILLAAIIFSGDVRRYLERQLTALGLLIQAYAPQLYQRLLRIYRWWRRFFRIYRYIFVALLIAALVLLFAALFIPSPELKAFAFLFASFVCIGIWLPFGIFLKLFRLRNNNAGVFPIWIKTLVSWLCFIGFISIVLPVLMSKLIVILGAILILGFFAGLSTKFDFLNRVAPAIVMLMLAWVGWKYVAPDSYRATTRIMAAKSEFLFAEADRNSVITEADAKATYGYLLKDISVAYKVTLRGDTISDISDIPVSLKKDSLFLVVNHKRVNYSYDGQSFIEIKLPNKNGSYVTGKKIWVEADLIEIGYRTEMDQSLETATDESEVSGFATDVPPILEEGSIAVQLKEGEKTSWFGYEDGKKYNYKISSPKYDFIVYFSDGSKPVRGGPDVDIPMKRHCYYKLQALSKQVITLTTEYL